jgi:hypothetical protein
VHAYLEEGDPYAAHGAGEPRPAQPNGMRLKIMRHVRLLQPPDERSAPWLDLGLGLDLDLDRQALQPVARLKVKDFLSVKAAPRWALLLGWLAGGVAGGVAAGHGQEDAWQAGSLGLLQRGHGVGDWPCTGLALCRCWPRRAPGAGAPVAAPASALAPPPPLAARRPLLKLSKSLPLPGLGMSVKLLYEVPLGEVQHFWEPPAKLMVRLDTTPGGWPGSRGPSCPPRAARGVREQRRRRPVCRAQRGAANAAHRTTRSAGNARALPSQPWMLGRHPAPAGPQLSPGRPCACLPAPAGSGMSGLHVSPAGCEFAGRAQLGRSLALIGAAGVSFPRQIPFSMDDPELGLRVHRLTVKSAW